MFGYTHSIVLPLCLQLYTAVLILVAYYNKFSHLIPLYCTVLCYTTLYYRTLRAQREEFDSTLLAALADKDALHKLAVKVNLLLLSHCSKHVMT